MSKILRPTIASMVAMSCLFGAGCAPSEPPVPSAEIAVPVPAATTTGPAPSAPSEVQAPWLESRSTDGNFHFMHPRPGERTVPSLEGDLALDLGPTVTGTKAFDVPTLALVVRKVTAKNTGLNGCYYSEMGWAKGQKPAEHKASYGGHEFCLTDTADAGAGNRWFTRTYATKSGKETLVFQFIVHSVECSNYDDPTVCVPFDQARDTKLMESVMQTVGFGP